MGKETKKPPVIMSRHCIKCGIEIKPIEPKKHFKPECSMWDGGIVDKVSAGYGSELDGNMYIIAICDNCIKENKDKIEFVGNYMGL